MIRLIFSTLAPCLLPENKIKEGEGQGSCTQIREGRNNISGMRAKKLRETGEMPGSRIALKNYSDPDEDERGHFARRASGESKGDLVGRETRTFTPTAQGKMRPL